VYTIYIDTALGTAVMEYADPSSAAHPYAEDLIAPQPMRADLPGNLKPSRLVIAFVLDRSGTLRNPQVLEPGRGDLTTKVLAALTSWKFRPVFRGDQAIEVNAILGFDIDTR
jgi:outer membrane biosynthesis protein TonB